MAELATCEIDGRIARLTLRRPDARNALSVDLLQALHDRVAELEAQTEREDHPTVVVVTGDGKAFCAGMDLRSVVNEPGAPPKLLTTLAELAVRLRALPMATVARVNGAAIGGGCGLTCVCDVAVTHADAKLGFPEVDLGVCPAVVAPWLTRKIGPGPARAVLLRGGVMSGAEAGRLGIADIVAEAADRLDEETNRVAEHLAAAGPKALAATKGLLNELDASLDLELARRGAALSASVLEDPELLAGLRTRFGF